MIDLFCGLGGWADGGIAEGFDVVGFDIERHHYGDAKYPAQLVIQDVLTLHGRQFKDAALIVASPPCQAYSYRAMPWKRAKALPPPDNSLFEACFRIQREAIEAAGHFIPLVVENVRGAQKWVGKARYNFGSYYLWGDVPALLPIPAQRRMKSKINCSPRNFSDRVASTPEEAHTPHYRLPADGFKTSGMNWSDRTLRGQDFTRIAGRQAQNGIKQGGICGPRENGKGDAWFQDGAARHGSKSNARKAASAAIAKIPFALAQWIAKVYYPRRIAQQLKL